MEVHVSSCLLGTRETSVLSLIQEPVLQAHTLVAILAFPDVSEEANVAGTEGEMLPGGPARQGCVYTVNVSFLSCVSRFVS